MHTIDEPDDVRRMREAKAKNTSSAEAARFIEFLDVDTFRQLTRLTDAEWKFWFDAFDAAKRRGVKRSGAAKPAHEAKNVR